MRKTITIDDDLYERALELADPQMDKKDVFREAIRTFIQIRAARRLLLVALLPAVLGGCGGNIHKKNLSDDFLVQGAARALNVAPEAITLSNRRGQGPAGIGFDISVTGDAQRYHCSIFTRGHLGWSLGPVGCGCHWQSEDDRRGWIGPCPAPNNQ